MSELQAVVFDIDGTLIDSNDAHARAWVDAFREVEIAVDLEQVRAVGGLGPRELIRKVGGLPDDDARVVQLMKRRSEIFRAVYLPTLQPFPRATDLLARMHGRGVHVAVVTSASADELGDLLEVGGIRALVEARATSSDVEHGAPEPDVIAAALAKLDVLDRTRALMIGDTPEDVAAAQRAGIEAIAFRCGGRRDDELQGAVAIYDGPADLFDHYDASIFARA